MHKDSIKILPILLILFNLSCKQHTKNLLPSKYGLKDKEFHYGGLNKIFKYNIVSDGIDITELKDFPKSCNRMYCEDCKIKKWQKLESIHPSEQERIIGIVEDYNMFTKEKILNDLINSIKVQSSVYFSACYNNCCRMTDSSPFYETLNLIDIEKHKLYVLVHTHGR